MLYWIYNEWLVIHNATSGLDFRARSALSLAQNVRRHLIYFLSAFPRSRMVGSCSLPWLTWCIGLVGKAVDDEGQIFLRRRDGEHVRNLSCSSNGVGRMFRILAKRAYVRVEGSGCGFGNIVCRFVLSCIHAKTGGVMLRGCGGVFFCRGCGIFVFWFVLVTVTVIICVIAAEV